jgi:lysine 6-dehydrogenase
MPQSNPPYSYIILGAGRQGTAAAYDLVRFGEAAKIVLADYDAETAQKAAQRVNALTNNNLATGIQLDVSDQDALKNALHGFDIALSAVPYYFNLAITKACIESGVSLNDMGGHTGVIREQLALDADAKTARISIVPDCGMGPGLITHMAAYAMELLDEPREVFIYDGGLPQNPVPPWNYQATFHINGLTNEMDGEAFFIRGGEVVPVETLTEAEWLEFPPLGRLEAEVTSGGLSTSPWTFQPRLQTYENRTLRYPGHFEWLRAFKALGLFSEESIEVGQQTVKPREVYHTLLAPHISAAEIHDVCVIRVIGHGIKDGAEATVTIDLIDYFDPETGFTAMERLTGWHCAIIMGFQARGVVPAGAIPMEIAVPPEDLMAAIAQRGIQFTVKWE